MKSILLIFSNLLNHFYNNASDYLFVIGVLLILFFIYISFGLTYLILALGIVFLFAAIVIEQSKKKNINNNKRY